MATTTLSVHDIVSTRRLDSDEDLTALIAHIHKNGLKVPILVSREHIVIDGLRRFEALQKLGLSDVPVTIATDYPVAIKEIERARKHGVSARIRWRRSWELFRDLQNLKLDYVAITRHKPIASRDGEQLGSRNMLQEALGYTTPAILQCLTQVYRLAEGDTSDVGDRAREAVEKLRSGEMTPYAALGYAQRPPRLTGDVTKAADQRGLLESASNTLSGVTKGLMKLGPLAPDINREELDAWLTSLKASRRDLTRLIRQLETGS